MTFYETIIFCVLLPLNMAAGLIRRFLTRIHDRLTIFP